MIAGAAVECRAGGFSPVGPGKSSGAGAVFGPSSNTGQKSAQGSHNAIIDFLTVVLPADKLEASGLTKLEHLLATVFGLRDAVRALPIRDKKWQFYNLSSVLVDRDGEMVGRIGLDGNGDTVCVSLSGAGCKWVDQWWLVARELERLGGRITRCDIAHDDYEGERLSVSAMRELAQAGAFASGGRPPKTEYISDEGHGTGCTLYVGAKGHKQLCIYEKGKQLGLPESKWVRAEVRLYAKHVEGRTVPLDALVNPVDYLRGSYEALREFIGGGCTRIKTETRKAAATAQAMLNWLRRQCGKSLGLMARAVQGDAVALVDALVGHVVREGAPGRFVGISGALIEQELRTCLAS